MTFFKKSWLLLTFAAFQFIDVYVWALPTVINYGHHTDRYAPNSIPGAPVGDRVQVVAFLDSSDPVGSPTISVEAIQGDTTITLDYIGSQHTLFEGLHLYYKFIDYDPHLTGSWEIVPTDSTGTGFSNFTPAIIEPEFLPLAEEITVQGTPLGALVSWTLPNFDGFDPDGLLVRVMDATSGGFVFESEVFPVQTTSYEPPAGILEVGVEYVYAVLMGDVEGSYLENTSWAFSEPFRFTVPGDFNQDGTVDAADYVAWRKGLGTTYTQNDFNTWRANFGATLGTGSSSAFPRPSSTLDSTVPEPASLFLLLLAGTGVFLIPRRRVAAKNRC
jgi:hypothetical protein